LVGARKHEFISIAITVLNTATLLLCCTFSYNPAQTDGKYIGPAAIVKGHRFYFDEREDDDIKDHRFDILAKEYGVWQCYTQFSCTTVVTEGNTPYRGDPIDEM
jgi:succinate dehydrogenase/fumarate reductase-like Fe-S protein